MYTLIGTTFLTPALLLTWTRPRAQFEVEDSDPTLSRFYLHTTVTLSIYSRSSRIQNLSMTRKNRYIYALLLTIF